MVVGDLSSLLVGENHGLPLFCTSSCSLALSYLILSLEAVPPVMPVGISLSLAVTVPRHAYGTPPPLCCAFYTPYRMPCGLEEGGCEW